MTASRVARIDWPRVFADLEAVGYTLSMAAAHLGISRETLKSYRTRGCEPNTAYGLAIIGLWCAAMQRGIEQAPKAPEPAPVYARFGRASSDAHDGPQMAEFWKKQMHLFGDPGQDLTGG